MKLIISFCFLNLTIQLSAQTKVVEFEGGYLTVMVANKWESTESKRTLSLTQKIVNENLQITYAFADGSTLDDFYKTYVSESFPEEFEGFKIIEEKSQTINGRKFKSILFNTRQYGREYQTIVYLTMNNDLGYAFIGTSTPSQMNSVASEFYDIISSVTFLTPGQKEIVKDENLEQVYGKKWLLYSQDFGFGNLPVTGDSQIYFELIDDNIIQSKTDNSEKCDVPFEYDNSKNEIKFLCRGRNLTKQILKVSSATLITKEVDELGETIERTYKASK
ncbi:MAG: hypothetical protein HRT61_21560 [Ekhidna sp.]|nr:hypothetical protein [Ekhidna sp.]